MARPTLSPLDSAIEDLRMSGGTLAALADALPLTPDNREWLRCQSLKESAHDRHARARADAQLMKELGIGESMRVAVLQREHYGGFEMQFTARVVRGDLGKSVLDKAAAHERWIRESPARLAKRLQNLPHADLR